MSHYPQMTQSMDNKSPFDFDWDTFRMDIRKTPTLWHRTLTDKCRYDLQRQCNYDMQYINDQAKLLDIRVSLVTVRHQTHLMQDLSLHALSFARYLSNNYSIPSLIHQMPLNRYGFSGRCIEHFITVIARRYDLYYYLHYNATLQTYHTFSRIPTSTSIRFHLYSSYQAALLAYSKNYFDTFNRGCVVQYGDDGCLSLCQSYLYLWCQRHKVFEYMHHMVGENCASTRQLISIVNRKKLKVLNTENDHIITHNMYPPLPPSPIQYTFNPLRTMQHESHLRYYTPSGVHALTVVTNSNDTSNNARHFRFRVRQ